MTQPIQSEKKRKRIVLGEGYPWLCETGESQGDLRIYKSKDTRNATRVKLNVPIPSDKKIRLIAEVIE